MPGSAQAVVDARFLPDHEHELDETLAQLLGPHVRIASQHRDIGTSAPFAGHLVDAIAAAVAAEDPGATVLPYMLSAGTDNKALSRLGIAGYGFAPLRLPADLDFPAMFHGVDERVPVESLQFGTRVLDRLLTTC